MAKQKNIDYGIISTNSKNINLNWETYEELREIKQKNNIRSFADTVAFLILRFYKVPMKRRAKHDRNRTNK